MIVAMPGMPTAQFAGLSTGILVPAILRPRNFVLVLPLTLPLTTREVDTVSTAVAVIAPLSRLTSAVFDSDTTSYPPLMARETVDVFTPPAVSSVEAATRAALLLSETRPELFRFEAAVRSEVM